MYTLRRACSADPSSAAVVWYQNTCSTYAFLIDEANASQALASAVNSGDDVVAAQAAYHTAAGALMAYDARNAKCASASRALKVAAKSGDKQAIEHAGAACKAAEDESKAAKKK